MSDVSNELDSLSLLFSHGVQQSVAFDRDMLRMQREAERTKARLNKAAANTKRQVEKADNDFRKSAKKKR